MAKPGALKVDHHVVSADGSRYRVRYVWEENGVEMADLVELAEGGDYTKLPTAELRRTVATKLPPITGLPEERPRCVMCDRKLQPSTDYEYAKREGGSSIYSQVLKRTFRHWRGYWANRTGDEKFCTTRCAMDFARAAFKAGYRIVRK